MSHSNSSKDTVLQLSVGKSNSSQKKYTNLKRFIIRRFKALWNLSIQKKIIYFLIIMICCWFLYPTYYDKVIQHKDEADEDLNLDLDLDDSPELKQLNNQFSDKVKYEIKKPRVRRKTQN